MTSFTLFPHDVVHCASAHLGVGLLDVSTQRVIQVTQLVENEDRANRPEPAVPDVEREDAIRLDMVSFSWCIEVTGFPCLTGGRLGEAQYDVISKT